MNLMNPSVAGYVLERAIECINGDWHFVYDAAPIGYAGLKVECLCNGIGELIAEFYRVAGRTFFNPDLAAAAWHGAYDYRVSDLCEQLAGAVAAESRNNTDQLSRPIAASVGQTSTETRRVAAASQGAAVALSGSEGGQ
jgi:hypothetical protein